MTSLDRIRNALSDFESIEAHGGHMPGMLPETFSVEDLRVVVEMAEEGERLRKALAEISAMPGYSQPIPENYVSSLVKRYHKALYLAGSALQLQDKTHDNTMGGRR